MLEKTSEYLTNQLYIKGEIEENKIEVIKYGFEILISSALILFSVPLYAGVIFRFSDGIMFMVFFMPIRLFSGGYHAPTYRKCYTCTMALFVMVILISYLLPIKNGALVLLGLIVCSGYIFVKAPCVNAHHPLTERRYKRNKVRARITVMIESVMSVILFFIDTRLCTISVYTLLLVVGMMVFPRKEEKAC